MSSGEVKGHFCHLIFMSFMFLPLWILFMFLYDMLGFDLRHLILYEWWCLIIDMLEVFIYDYNTPFYMHLWVICKHALYFAVIGWEFKMYTFLWIIFYVKICIWTGMLLQRCLSRWLNRIEGFPKISKINHVSSMSSKVRVWRHAPDDKVNKNK